MTKAGERMIAGAKEALETVRLRGGPGFDFPCNNPGIIECARWECQKERKCRLDGPPSSQAVEVRRNPDNSIDEIVAKGANLHIEQMTDDGWFMGLDMPDGSYWQFWFGAKNRKSHVEFRHVERS